MFTLGGWANQGGGQFMRKVVIAGCAAFVVAAGLFGIIGARASAQVLADQNRPPPVLNPSAVDANGVNLTSTAYSFKSPFSLGAPATSHLQLRFQAVGWNISTNFNPPFFEDSTALQGGYGLYWEITTSVGGTSRKYICEWYYPGYYCNQVYMNDGATLVVSSYTYSATTGKGDPKEYQLTDRDGTVYIIQSNIVQPTSAQASNVGSLKGIIYPSGEKLTGGTGFNASGTVTSNLGYKIVRGAPYSLYKGTTALTTHSISEVYNNAAGTSAITETDALNRTFVTNWTAASGCPARVNTLTSPTGLQTSVAYANTYTHDTYGNYRVTSVTRGGSTWSYSASSGSVTATNPLSQSTIVSSTARYPTAYVNDQFLICGGARYTSADITSVSDPLSRATSYQYALQPTFLKYLLTQATLPEGNGSAYEYDTRLNLTKVTRRAKSGSGLADTIIYQASFDTTCSNPKTCNQPNWTREAKGNQSDYTYHSHGGVSVATLPADAAGLRQRTYYFYEAYDTGDGIIQRLNRTETCGLNSGQLSLTACPANADTAVTTSTYWEKTFLPLTVTQTDGAGSLSVTTTYAYDNWGRATSVDGPLAGTGDTTYATYDAAHRKICEIGVDPDGGGALVRAMVRHTYNAANQETKTETGTGTSTTDCTPGVNMTVSSFNRMTYDTIGRLTKTETVQP
jgi:hypothetical protein